jgi:hypothetical protein
MALLLDAQWTRGASKSAWWTASACVYVLELKVAWLAAERRIRWLECELAAPPQRYPCISATFYPDSHSTRVLQTEDRPAEPLAGRGGAALMRVGRSPNDVLRWHCPWRGGPE